MEGSTSSTKSLIGYMHGLDDAQLGQSLRIYLKEGAFGEVAVYTVLERHRFVAKLFNACDTTLQERMRRVFANLLESFEGTNPKDDAEYLFYLLSLASAIRCAQTKERLRRWIRQDTFAGWKHGIFDLSSELILAIAPYDSDEEWVDFILNVLPKRSSFRNIALAAYRAMWQMKGVECLSLIPGIMIIADLEDAAFSQSLGYLLRLTIDKVGAEQSCKTAIAALNRIERPVHEIWTIVLRIEEVIDRELPLYRDELNPLTEHLEEAWNKAVGKWHDLPAPYLYEAFDKLLDVREKDWEEIRIRIPGIKAAFRFRKKYRIEIREDGANFPEPCEQFLEEINYEEEEPVYLTGPHEPLPYVM